LIRTFAEQWITDITDITLRVRQIADLVHNGHAGRVERLLPPERLYPVSETTATKLLIDT
jgi:hypothetical protein